MLVFCSKSSEAVDDSPPSAEDEDESVPSSTHRASNACVKLRRGLAATAALLSQVGSPSMFSVASPMHTIAATESAETEAGAMTFVVFSVVIDNADVEQSINDDSVAIAAFTWLDQQDAVLALVLDVLVVHPVRHEERGGKSFSGIFGSLDAAKWCCE